MLTNCLCSAGSLPTFIARLNQRIHCGFEATGIVGTAVLAVVCRCLLCFTGMRSPPIPELVSRYVPVTLETDGFPELGIAASVIEGNVVETSHANVVGGCTGLAHEDRVWRAWVAAGGKRALYRCWRIPLHHARVGFSIATLHNPLPLELRSLGVQRQSFYGQEAHNESKNKEKTTAQAAATCVDAGWNAR